MSAIQADSLKTVNTVKAIDQVVVDTLIKEKASFHGSYKLGSYVASHLREHPVLRKAREHANGMGALQAMQISADEGAVLQMLVRMTQAKRCVEVGFFTGYSALAVALAIPPDGLITAIDVKEEWAKTGEGFFEEAGVRNKLDLRIQNGITALDELLESEEGTFDFGFIDADKTGYIHYYERIIQLLRPGGVLAIDNVLWLDRVANEEFQDEDTTAMRLLNDRLVADDRIELAYLPTADGVAICWKK